jgi:low affinity Fe/Cu permease
MNHTDDHAPLSPKGHIARKTAQLPIVSKVLYRIDHYSSMPALAAAVAGLLVILLAIGAGLGFSTGWLTGFEVSVSAVTLLMVFVIQHTQGREQAATQRKLDELLRVIPGAADSLMMLEEAPQQVLLEVEDEQRGTRSKSVEAQVNLQDIEGDPEWAAVPPDPHN